MGNSPKKSYNKSYNTTSFINTNTHIKNVLDTFEPLVDNKHSYITFTDEAVFYTELYKRYQQFLLQNPVNSTLSLKQLTDLTDLTVDKITLSLEQTTEFKYILTEVSKTPLNFNLKKCITHIYDVPVYNFSHFCYDGYKLFCYDKVNTYCNNRIIQETVNFTNSNYDPPFEYKTYIKK